MTTGLGQARQHDAGLVTGADGRPLDRIALTGLSATGYHGVLDSERRDGQVFRCDVLLHLDTRPAAASDDLADTVDYAAVSEQVVEVLTGEPCRLVERVVEQVAAVCLRDPRVHAVDVTLHKPQAPVPVPVDDVSVHVRRTRGELA